MSCDRMLSCCSDAARVNSLPIKSHVARHSPKSNIVAMDGVYAPGLDGKPEFFALRPRENGEVRELAQLLAKRIPALLTRRGAGTLPPDEGESDRLARDQPWLSEVYAASVSGRIATGPEAGRRGAVGRDRVDPESIDSSASPRCAAVAGFSLHGNVAIHAEDRSRLEDLQPDYNPV